MIDSEREEALRQQIPCLLVFPTPTAPPDTPGDDDGDGADPGVPFLEDLGPRPRRTPLIQELPDSGRRPSCTVSPRSFTDAPADPPDTRPVPTPMAPPPHPVASAPVLSGPSPAAAAPAPAPSPAAATPAPPTAMDDIIAIVERAERDRRGVSPAPTPAPVSAVFGSGFQRGFLCRPTPPPTPTPAALPHPAPPTVLRGAPSGTAVTDDEERWQLPEVDRALRALKGQVTGTGAAAAAALLDPELAERLRDPRLAAVLEELRRDPRAALWRLQADPSLDADLRGLMGALGQHFEALSRSQEEISAAGMQVAPRTAAEAPLMRPVPPPMEADEEVAAVLRDPELRGLLTDPGMQRVLEECGTPAGLARHLRDAPTKARLLRLARAGLVRLEL